MFFRGRQPETSIWRRFRSAADGFTFTREGDHYVARVVANAERTVDLFHALLAYLSPAVDLVVEDARTGAKWKGESIALPDVRDAVARLKMALAAHGGVEIAVYTSEDQVTLSPALELFVYSRTDQWSYLLEGKGLEQRRELRSRSAGGGLHRGAYPAAPELADALTALASNLGLAPA
jgi:hypothetical protein